MANRTYYPSQSSGLNQVWLTFELLGAGAAALTIPSGGAGANVVASISRSGVGVYVITLKDAWSKCLFKSADMDDTLNDGSYATVSDVANEGTATAMTFTVRTRNSGGIATECAASRRLGISLCMRNGVANQGS